MKKIIISDDRKLNISNVVIGYLQENKIEKLEFEIPKEYENFGRKACFNANGNTFTKTFDNIIGNTITLTRDITQYQDLFMTIAFFKIEDEDEIIARTSTLHILIQDAVICDDDIKPDEPKVIILDNLITKVTNLDNTVTKNEEIREANETTRQQNETTREENEINRVNSEANREKAEESRKKAELERVSNENTRQSNEEERKAAENERVSNENAREEYINNLKAQVDNGDFDGADFNYKWDGTKLGVKNSKETTYQFVELKGQKGDKGGKGDKGDTGNGIQNIEKVSTVGNVDTYAINYTDGTQTTFDVTNGEVTKEQLDEVDNKAKNTRNELERVKNDVLETGTDNDTYIHLEDSAMAEYQELSVDGVCEQETTSIANGDEYDSPSPDHPQPISTIENSLKITSCNKNLFDSNREVNSTFTSSIKEALETYKTTGKYATGYLTNSDSITSYNVYTTCFVKNKANTNYCISDNSIENKGFSCISILDKDGNVLYHSQNWQGAVYRINGLSNACYVAFGARLTNYINVQLEEGTTNTSYEPYQGSSLNITIPENEFVGKIGDIKDTLNIVYKDDGHYHLNLYKNIGRVVLDGSEDIKDDWQNYDTPDYIQFYLTSKIFLNSNYIDNKAKNCKCNNFISPGNSVWNYNNEGFAINEDIQKTLQFKLSKQRIKTIDDFKSWLSTNNTEVYYPLATPYEVDLGIIDTLITYNETTNLFTDSDLLPTINAKYYRNFISTVRNLQVNEKALKQELVDINNRLSALENANVVDNNPTEESEATNDIQVQ